MPQTDDKIMWLLSAFDKPQSSFFTCYYRGSMTSWRPETEEERQAFVELIAPENREQLKMWYSRLSSINDMADVFRHVLEQEIGEALPIGRKV